MIPVDLQTGHSEVFCRVTGSGEPLFLLHNGFYSQQTWDTVIDDLAQNYTVYSYDRFGYGHSTHLQEMSLDIVELGVQELEQIISYYQLSKVNLLGHCLGGAIALFYTAQHPENVNKVIAESVGYYSDEGLQIKTDWTFQPYEKIPQMLRDILEEMHGFDYAKVFWDAIRNYKGGYIMNPEYNISKIVKTIKNPVLLVVGDRDFYFDIAHSLPVYKKLKNAQFAVIPNGDHDIHISNKNVFLYTIKSFLD